MTHFRPNFKKRRCVSMEIRGSAQGEPCDLRLDGCNGGDETTVWVHFRFFAMAGAGQKPHDFHGCRACATCHDILDGRRNGTWGWDDVLRAMMQAQDFLYQREILTVKGDKG